MGTSIVAYSWLKNLPEYKDMITVLGAYEATKDYAGAEGDWKAKFISRTICGVDINVACYIHDYWYFKGGNQTDRAKVDGLFLTDMMTLIDMTDSWWVRKFFARHRATTYFHFVREHGQSSFEFNIKESA